MKHRNVHTAAALAIALAWATGPARADGQQCLNDLERKIAGDYRSIPHVTPEQLDHALTRPGEVLLLDARAAEEVGVSRLPGAVLVDPDIDTDEFVSRYTEAARGRDVIIYCSVGVRSSKLATRVRDTMMTRGARSVANLRGGIFGLHNTGHGLVDAAGGTEFVHPYSRWWRSYLDFTNLSRYEAR